MIKITTKKFSVLAISLLISSCVVYDALDVMIYPDTDWSTVRFISNSSIKIEQKSKTLLDSSNSAAFQNSYRLLSAPFGQRFKDSFTVKFYYKHDGIWGRGKYYETIKFTNDDIGKVKKGKAFKFATEYDLEPRTAKVSYPYEKFNSPRWTTAKGTVNLGIHSQGSLEKGIRIYANGNISIGNFSSRGYITGNVRRIFTSGAESIGSWDDGKRHGDVVFLSKDGKTRLAHYDKNRGDITQKVKTETIKQMVASKEKQELKEALAPLDKEIKEMESRVNQMTGRNSAYASVVKQYSKYDSEACSCVFNICLTTELTCSSEWQQSAAKGRACDATLDDRKRYAEQRRKIRRNACWAMKRSGILPSKGERLEDLLLNANFEGKKISDKTRMELEKARNDLQQAKLLKNSAIAKTKQRLRSENELKSQQRMKREQRMRQAKLEYEKQQEKRKADILKSKAKWEACVSRLGLDPKNIQEWKVYPESC